MFTLLFAENLPDFITLVINHGGFFTKCPGRKYVKGKTTFVDLVDCDQFSVLEINDMIQELGYTSKHPMWYHFKIPNSDLDRGLQDLGTDQDIINLLKYTSKYKVIEVFIEHWMTNVTPSFTSPGGSHVVIEELPSQVPPEQNYEKPPKIVKASVKASCKKQLLLEYKSIEVTEGETEGGVQHGERVDSVQGDQGGETEGGVQGDQGGETEGGVQGDQGDETEGGVQGDQGGETEGGVQGDQGYIPTQVFDDIPDVDTYQQQQFDPFGDFDPFWADKLDERQERGEENERDEPATTRMEEMTSDEIENEGDDSDSDYSMDVGDEGDADMSNFNSVVDWNVEWLGQTEDAFEEHIMDESGNPIDISDFASGSDSDVERPRRKKLESLAKQHKGDTNFYIGQQFGTKKEVKNAIRLHSIETRRDLLIIRNDKIRMRAVCKGMVPTCNQKSVEASKGKAKSKGKKKAVEVSKDEGICPWVLHISTSKDDRTWVVKTYVDKHTCLQCRKVRQCTSSFLAEQIEETIIPNPHIPLVALKEQLERKLELGVSRHKLFRAKTKAMNRVMGSYSAQYSLLRDYTHELQRTNPGTTVKLELEHPPNITDTTRQFKRIYVCLGPLKKGFKACKRDLLGLDGAFMKGPFPGQLLTAVGLDPNHGTYPLAYAIVEAECTDSWSWFLECLGDDLELERNSNFTFISDRQKGVIPAVARVFPCAEHRYCIRHIYENMKKRWRGKEYKDLLYKCAGCTTIPEFNRCMAELRQVNKDAYAWLKEIPPQSWAKSHFSGRAHTDVTLNNMCEVFNSQLVDARDKPIIMALEYVRVYLMKRIVNVKKLIEKSEGILTPTAKDELELVKTDAAKYRVLWSGGPKYQVTGPWGDQCGVDLTKMECACRVWELTGIPCKHLVAVIWHMAANGLNVDIPERWVHPCYTMETWKSVYAFTIDPINSRDRWVTTDSPLTITPPKHHIQVGRPKKKRRKTTDEGSQPIVSGSKLLRRGTTVTCGKCMKKGHNSRTCKGQDNS
ncbi:hypothetical protein OSB04_016502 [Centaurea solstitialis]|uniref:SWIM-type domain-containing protein n=1 Tax=Centaurea solstitialis TaxID=347529 RepID=A0AA38W8J4_9ASTR|nr:hypothetical protein OSB04_016502 [Centaurea solstitialis]